MQGKTKQNGKQQHLQNIAAGKGANYAVGDDIQQESNDALLFCLLRINRHGFGIQRGRVNVHSRTRLHHVNHNQADNQRDGADNFKIEQCNRSGSSYRFHAFHASDAGHHGTENHRGDNHLD